MFRERISMFKGMAVAGAFAGAAMFTAPAMANFIPIADQTLNFEEASAINDPGAIIPNISGVQFMVHQTTAFVGFNDHDNSGTISAGDTFTEYAVFRIQNFQDQFENPVISPGYQSTHEITGVFVIEGVQTTNNTFAFTSLPRFEIYFDSGDGFTLSNTFTLSTFADGTMVETGDLLSGVGINADTVGPSGTADLFLSLQDLLVPDHSTDNPFQFNFFDAQGNSIVLGAGIIEDLLVGFVDANINQFNFDAAGLQQATWEDFFSINMGTVQADGFTYLGGDFDFGFTLRATGEFQKFAPAPIPEPMSATLGLLGLAGLGLVTRRRRLA